MQAGQATLDVDRHQYTPVSAAPRPRPRCIVAGTSRYACRSGRAAYAKLGIVGTGRRDRTSV